MKISLRKSNALQLSITDLMNSISLNMSVELNPFTDHGKVIGNSYNEFLANLEKINDLRDILYSIRKKTAKQNSISGVDDVLADIANLDKKIKTYSVLASEKNIMDDMSVISARLEKIKNRTDDSYYNNDTITVSILYKPEVEMYGKIVRSLKKDKQKLQDTLLELNVKNEIELDDSQVSFLKELDLL